MGALPAQAGCPLCIQTPVFAARSFFPVSQGLPRYGHESLGGEGKLCYPVQKPPPHPLLLSSLLIQKMSYETKITLN